MPILHLEPREVVCQIGRRLHLNDGLVTRALATNSSHTTLEHTHTNVLLDIILLDIIIIRTDLKLIICIQLSRGNGHLIHLEK